MKDVTQQVVDVIYTVLMAATAMVFFHTIAEYADNKIGKGELMVWGAFSLVFTLYIFKSLLVDAIGHVIETAVLTKVRESGTLEIEFRTHPLDEKSMIADINGVSKYQLMREVVGSEITTVKPIVGASIFSPKKFDNLADARQFVIDTEANAVGGIE